MAKLHEEVVVIKVSTMLRDDVTATPVILTEEVIQNLEVVVQELAGGKGNTLVEIQVA
jgi:hypothetical protein